MDVDTTDQAQYDALVYFDTTLEGFPFRPPRPREIETRRAQMSDVLIFDILLSSGGIRNTTALYPPANEDALRRLLSAIEESSYDALKRDCLIYFLLKWHQDGREEAFEEKQCIPPQFVALADAYWYLDTGTDVPRAISILSDARLNRDYPSKIIQAISLADSPNPLILRYVRTAKPILTEPDDIDAYAMALADSSLFEAWQYQRTYPEQGETRPRLIRKILHWCLAPKPRSRALTQLIAYPFSGYEQSLVHAFALRPPPTLPPSSIPIIQDLVCVRLIQSGQYAAAVKLDRQFSDVPIRTGGAARAGESTRRAAQERRQMMEEIMSVMPAVERQLLELELENLGQGQSSDLSTSTSRSGMGMSGDLSMSWENLRGISAAATKTKTNGFVGKRTVPTPRTSDVFKEPIPQRSGAPRFGGPTLPISANISPTTINAFQPASISGTSRAPPAFGQPPPLISKASGGPPTGSLYERVGSANRAPNAFYQPSDSSLVSGSISAGTKRAFPQDQQQQPSAASLSAMSSGSAVRLADTSSASASAVVRELFAEEGADGEESEDVDADVEMETSFSAAVGQAKEKERERLERRSSPPSPSPPPKASQTQTRTEVENDTDQREFSFSLFTTSTNNNNRSSSASALAQARSKSSIPSAAAGKKVKHGPTTSTKNDFDGGKMPPGAFVPDDEDVDDDFGVVVESGPARVVPPASPQPHTRPRQSRTQVDARVAYAQTKPTISGSSSSSRRQPRKLVKVGDGLGRSLPGSLMDEDHDEEEEEEEEEDGEDEHAYGRDEEERERRRREERDEREWEEEEEEEDRDVVPPLPPISIAATSTSTTTTRRQSTRKPRASLHGQEDEVFKKDTKSTKDTKHKRDKEREREKEKRGKEPTIVRPTRRSSRLSAVSSSRGSSSPEPLSPVKRKSVKSSAAGVSTATRSGKGRKQR